MDTQTVVVLVIAAVVLTVVGLALIRRRDRGTAAVPPTADGRLTKTAAALGAALRGSWSKGIDGDDWAGIEDALIAADVGIDTAGDVVAGVKASKPESVEQARAALATEIVSRLNPGDRSLSMDAKPSVILVVGVNGTGKTTTIAKLGRWLTAQGKSVSLAAADTFRAAAGEQLTTWAERLDVPVVKGQEGGDPAAVVYDAVESAVARQIDVVIVDTAGRLHAKKNLMAELSKIYRVADGEGGRVDEVLLVLDATGGQNGFAQVAEFSNAVPVSGIVLTKLDGTARGGIVVAVERELGIPVKFIGVGEGAADFEPFEPNRFVSDLLQES